MNVVHARQRLRKIERPDDFGLWARPHIVAMVRTAAVVVGRSAVDDVVQESLLRAWQRRETYDPQRGTPRAWLLGITLRQAVRYRTRNRPDETAEWVIADAIREDDDLDVDIDLRGHVGALPPRQREVIVLFYYVDLTIHTIAELLAISEGTVKSTLHDARTRLASSLGEEADAR